MVATRGPLHRFGGLVTADEDFSRVLREAERAAGLELGILVTGETGTGKELLARAIHGASRRADGPFVAVDCTALPEGTLQSELFGHRRGAFSGAESDRVGRFEAARGGTLFLDAVDELPGTAQTGLLRAVEEREVLPLGEARPRRVDFRLLASASPALKRRVGEGSFRRDLFYRLHVVEIELPPLRERPKDLPLLARQFLRDCARRFRKPLHDFTAPALEVLLAFDWPGNVRELQAVVEAAAASTRGEWIQESDLPVYLRVPRRPPLLEAGSPESPPAPAGSAEEDADGTGTFARRVEEFQRALLLETLGRKLWNGREAARELGLERHQLKYLCAKLGIRK